MNNNTGLIAIFSGLLFFRMFTEMPRVLRETGWVENSISDNLLNQLCSGLLIIFCFSFIVIKRKLSMPNWFILLTFVFAVLLLIGLVKAFFTFTEIGMPLYGIFVVTLRFVLEWLLVLFVLNYFVTPMHLDALFTFFLKPTIFAICLIGFFQLITSSLPSVQGIERIPGPFGSPTTLAGFLHLFIVLTFYYYEGNHSYRFWLLLFFQYVLLFYTGSVATIAAHCMFLVLVGWKQRWIRLKVFYNIFPLIAAITISAIVVKWDSILMRLSIIFNLDSFQLTRGSSLKWRWDAWISYLSLLGNSFVDWIFGLGIGTQRFILHSAYPNSLWRKFDAPGSHNDYLAMLIDFGLIGLLLFIIALIVLNNAMRTMEKSDSNLYYIRYYLMSVLIIMLTENYIDQLIMFVFIIFLTAITRTKRESGQHLETLQETSTQ